MERWTTINIFISSTFNDMQSERDYIRKYVIPRISVELANHRITIQVTDLRWGVDTHDIDENERESKVLHVCLDAIRHNRPFFIGLLGDRYGWIPSKEKMEQICSSINEDERKLLGDISDKSVTEMEILFGAIGDAGILPHSLFFFRQKKSYQDMSQEKMAQFCDCMSTNDKIRAHADKLDSLKKKIIDSCKNNGYENNVFYYTSKWDKDKDAFTKLEDFGEMLYNSLMREILEEIEINPDEGKTTFQIEKEALETFIIEHTKGFKGRKQLIAKLEIFLLNTLSASDILNNKTGYFLSGFSGCGKSALFSMLYSRLEEIKEDSKLIILAHSAGITPNSFIAEKMIEKWTQELSKIIDNSFEEETYFNLEHFENLLLRAQGKGYRPIILIDSLDRFTRTETITKFDFIPYNIPFICTTLPHCADEIIANKEKYGIYDMDSFTEEEACLVIDDILKDNNKKLSHELIDKLLSIRKETQHAYESPLWLRMSLSILMELGECDFKEIHKEQIEKEDEKIEVYLNRLISSFPGDAAKQFEFLLTLTYNYFNKKLAQLSLTYIALSRFGLRENDLEVLLGKEWNTLDFTCLRCWLRYFINCNNPETKWNFSHHILRETLLQQDSKIVERCRQSMLNYLKERVQYNEEVKEEFMYQIIVNNEYDMLMNYIDENNSEYESDAFCSFFVEKLLIESERQTLSFIDGYLAKHYKVYQNWIIYMANRILYATSNDRFSKESAKAISLIDLYINKFSPEDYLSGDIETLNTFFAVHDGKLSFLEYNHKDDEYETIFKHLQKIYYSNKKMHGDTFIGTYLIYDFFYYWLTYVRIVRDQNTIIGKSNVYLDQLDRLFNELENLCKKVPKNRFVYAAFSYISNEFRKGNTILPVQKSISYLQRAQNILMVAYTAEPENRNLLNAFIEQEYLLIQRYVALFNHSNYIDTPMTLLIKENDYQIDSKDFRSILIPAFLQSKEIPAVEPIDEFKTGTISLMSEEEMEEIEELDNMNGDEFDEDEEETTVKVDRPISTIDEIREAEKALDACLKQYSLDNDNILNESYKHFKSLAILYQRIGETEKAIQLMDNMSSILLEILFTIGDNYAIGEEDMNNFMDLSEWYGECHLEENQRLLLESVCNNLLHSFMHHIDGYGQLYIFNKLISFYEEHNIIDENLALQEKMFDMAFFYYIERSFNYDIGYYRDLGSVRTIFRRVSKSLKDAGEIKRAVIACEKWMTLCNLAYTDEKDTGWGYDDFDETYCRLARLYDGTPTIVEGMEERKSIFLKDQCILVCKNGKWGYISHQGQEIIECIFESAWKESGGLLSVRMNGKWGYINLKGEQIIDYILDAAIPSQDGYLRIRVNDKWAIIQPDGTSLEIKAQCKKYCEIKGGVMKVRVNGAYDWNTDFLRLDGENLLFGGQFSVAQSVNQGVIIAGYYKDSYPYIGLFDTQGNAIVPTEYYYIAPFGEEYLTPFRKNDTCGFINRQGLEVILAKYYRVRPMSNGIAPVSYKGSSRGSYYWGFVNEQGEEIVPTKYNDVGSFHDGLAWVCEGERGLEYGFKKVKFGFIDSTGKLKLPIIYDDVTSFYNGRALVCINNKMFYIDTQGNEII